jgi:hypothetical protein
VRIVTDTAAKLAAVQSLMDAVMGEAPVDATVVLSSTLARQGGETGETPLAASRIPSLVLAGRSLEALAACQAALAAPEGAGLQSGLKPRIAELRRLLERELLTTQDIDLVTATGRIHLLPRRSVLIGRPSSEKPVDVAVNCRWFSRGDHNLSLFREGANWFVEDLGSTNGSSIGGDALKPGHPVALQPGETRVEIGAVKGASALATVHFCRPSMDPGAIVITLSGSPGVADRGDDPWPSMQEDMTRRWIVFRQQVGISAAEDCALRLQSEASGILAALRYQSGFWIVPSSQCALQMDSMPFGESVPLPADTTLSLAGTTLRVERSELMRSACADAQGGPQAMAG